jgi:homoprotocatechuate degradation regulator HpaR
VSSPCFLHVIELMRETRKSLPIALLRTREAVMAHFRPMLASYDLNEQQWRVIRVLEEHGELDATALAQKAYVLGPSLTRMIKSLEERKLLISGRDARDGRRTLLRLSTKAKNIVAEIAPKSDNIFKAIEQKLGVRNTDELLRLLDQVATKLES